MSAQIPDDIHDTSKYAKITVYVAKADGRCYISTTKDLTTDDVIEVLEASLETFTEDNKTKEKEYKN